MIAITDNSSYLKEKADYIFRVPNTHSMLTPFMNVIPLQLLASSGLSPAGAHLKAVISAGPPMPYRLPASAVRRRS